MVKDLYYKNDKVTNGLNNYYDETLVKKYNFMFNFDDYLVANKEAIHNFNNPIIEDDVSKEDLELKTGDGDITDLLQNEIGNNKDRKNNRCPLFNGMKNPELPGVPPVNLPPEVAKLEEAARKLSPLIGLIQSAASLPMPVLAASFGVFGRGLIMASQLYAKEQLTKTIIEQAHGDECIIDAANKLNVAMTTAAQVQYMIAQPVVVPPVAVSVMTAVGPAVGIGVPTGPALTAPI